MSRDLSESDLLAVVEGNLSPERVEIVRAALTSDPDLLRRIQGMVRDRQLLMDEADSGSAPHGLIESSLHAAEREALLTRNPGQGRLLRSRKVVAALSLAAALGLTVGVSIFVMVGYHFVWTGGTVPNADFEMTEHAPDAVEEELPLAILVNEMAHEPPRERPRLSEEAAAASVPPAAPSPSLQESLASIENWWQEATEKIGPDSQDPFDADDELQWERVLNQTVQLALEGRLKIRFVAETPLELAGVLGDIRTLHGVDLAFVERRPAHWTDEGVVHTTHAKPAEGETGISRDQGGGHGDPGDEGSPPTESPTPQESNLAAVHESFEVDLVITREDPFLAVRRALLDLLALARSNGAIDYSIESAPALRSNTESLLAEDVFWWTRPPERWLARILVQFRVEVIESGNGRISTSTDAQRPSDTSMSAPARP